MKAEKTPDSAVLTNILMPGNRAFASNLTKLRKNKVTSIVNCGAGKCSFQDYDSGGETGKFRYHKLKLKDCPSDDLLSQLPAATAFIEEEIGKGGTVLVHCMGGFSRSPSVVCAWLIRYRGLSFEDALQEVRAVRSCANPNEGFVKQLKAWASQPA